MRILLTYIITLMLMAPAYGYPPVTDPNTVVQELNQEVELVAIQYSQQRNLLHTQLQAIQKNITISITTEEKLNLLLEKDQLRDRLQALAVDEEGEITKIRYIKGLQIIRILYDKVLALDHHFVSVQTFSEINKISNPNHYPEFSKVQEMVKEKKDKKFNLDLTQLLGANSFASVTGVFLNLFGSTLSNDEKKQNWNR